MKTLKFWNGRAYGARGHLYIAAYSRKDAAQLYCEAQAKVSNIDLTKRPHWIDKRSLGRANREIQTYFGDCWGSNMIDVVPERGVWYSEKDHSPIRRLI